MRINQLTENNLYQSVCMSRYKFFLWGNPVLCSYNKVY